MKSIRNIYLAWRAGRGERRHIVGVIKKNVTDGVRFSYKKENLKEAMQAGFVAYTDFPKLDVEYAENVLDIFAQRLTKSERADIKGYYDFWEIETENRDDVFYLLAHTQGLLATDNYEFLAEYMPVKGLKFVSEVCGLYLKNIPKSKLEVGDKLTWKLEPQNQHDKFAVKVFKDEEELGYMKQVHNRLFYRLKKHPATIRIKSISDNADKVEHVFITVSI